MHDPGWYAAQQVELRIGERATVLDPDARRVLPRLRRAPAVRAPGDRDRGPSPDARHPRGAAAGRHTLRTRADSDRLREALARDQRWVIIGAGWIGLELAAAASAAGRTVTVLESAALPLQRVLGAGSAPLFRDVHLGNGVDLRTGVAVRGIRRSGDGLTVLAGDEPIDADIVVVAVGVTPNTELADGLAVIDGIVVDQRLRTSDPHVLAAGDVATSKTGARAAPARRPLGQRHPAGPARGGHDPGRRRRVRLAALLLHRPVRPRHGVRRPQAPPATRSSSAAACSAASSSPSGATGTPGSPPP